MSSGPARVLDARDLPPPEPFAKTLEALAALPPGEQLLLLLYREPFPLYAHLDQQGFERRTELRPDGTYAISIRRPAPGG